MRLRISPSQRCLSSENLRHSIMTTSASVVSPIHAPRYTTYSTAVSSSCKLSSLDLMRHGPRRPHCPLNQLLNPQVKRVLPVPTARAPESGGFVGSLDSRPTR